MSKMLFSNNHFPEIQNVQCTYQNDPKSILSITKRSEAQKCTIIKMLKAEI